MHALLQNKFIRFGLMLAGTLAALLIALVVFSLVQTSSDGLGTTMIGMDADYYTQSAPAAPGFFERDAMYTNSATMEDAIDSTYYPYHPSPVADNYTANLESYETTSYNVTARTKNFDGLCDAMTGLKADPQIHFRTITSTLNNCYATFYVAEAKVESVLSTLTKYHGVEVSRNTESVTRHKEQLESQTAILQQQLARVESSLAAAQTQLDRLNQIFNSSDEVTRLSGEVTRSLQYIDQLTARKIALISQLDTLYQQSADLTERMQVVEFSVSVTRTTPVIIDKYASQWDRAWEDLKNEFINTLIGLTAFFGIFLLWVLRGILYSLVIIVLVRGLWKFVKLVWSRW